MNPSATGCSAHPPPCRSAAVGGFAVCTKPGVRAVCSSCARLSERLSAALGPRRAPPQTTEELGRVVRRGGAAPRPEQATEALPRGKRCGSGPSAALLTLRRTASSPSRSCSRTHHRWSISQSTPRRTGHRPSLLDSLRHRCRWRRSSPQRRCSHRDNCPRRRESTDASPSRRERTGGRRPRTRTVSRLHRVRRCPCCTPPRA